MNILRALCSAFILLNLTALAYSNRPPWIARAIDELVSERASPWLAYRLRLVAYRLASYAAATGLDARWEMFSNVKGFDWQYRITAFEGGREHVLPLPGQSPRSFWEEFLFDFKEGKFRLNTARDSNGRQAYAAWLCREFDVERVTIWIDYRRILDPRSARLEKRTYDRRVTSRALETRSCG